MTNEEKAEIRRLRKDGMSWNAIGGIFGVTPDTVRGAIDPEFRARRNAQIEHRRKMRRMGEHFTAASIDRASLRADAERRMEEIPADTRDLTALILGDPIPGRRAIDFLEAAE